MIATRREFRSGHMNMGEAMQPSLSPREGDTKIAALDTLGISRRLKDVGFSDAQAEAVTEIIRDARSADLAGLASKVDIERFQVKFVAGIEILRRDLTTRVGAMIIGATVYCLPRSFSAERSRPG
jgi:hypothetical protein